VGDRPEAVSAPVEVTEWRTYWALGTGRSVLYIGQTERDGIARWAEHLRRQPWAGEIESLELMPQRYHRRKDVLAAERDLIHRYQPKYNGTHNSNNPHRVIVQRGPGTRRQRTAVAPAGYTWWTWRRIRYALAVGGWLTALGAIWWAAAVKVGAGQGFMLAAVAMVVVTIAALSQRPKRRRRRR
jgi:hypothetical protein